MDDGIVPLPANFNLQLFVDILNAMDDNLQFTVERSITSRDKSSKTKDFLDITLRLHRTGNLETDVYYKPTNNHDYLNYNSHHPKHVKDNVPYNLAKRIVVFCSDPSVETSRLAELKTWLLKCDYPESLIDSKFFKAKLQGPAPEPDTSKIVVPFVTTNFSNYDPSNIPRISKNLLEKSRNARVTEVYRNVQPIISLRQPRNLLRRLSKAEFSSSNSTSDEHSNEPGLFRCNSNSCLLCKDGYIQQCKSFKTSNGFDWQIRCYINCNSKNVIYFLKCTSCNTTTYIGKTNNFRKRLNGHKSSSNLGTSSDVFDNHVFRCRKKKNYTASPNFLVYALLTVKHKELLLTYEDHFHRLGFDTMN